MDLGCSNEFKGLRVALLAGTLEQGGAEKQFVYIAGALLNKGIDIRVYTLVRGNYDAALREMGIEPIWIGRYSSPVLRLTSLVYLLRSFRPHLIQSGHAFTNLYVALAGKILNAISIGAIRSSLVHTRDGNGLWTRWLIESPTCVVANSQATLEEIINYKNTERRRPRLLPNVIALSEDRGTALLKNDNSSPVVIFVGRLISIKRLDRFLRAFAFARQECPKLKGMVVGEGPERRQMEQLAAQLELSGSVAFLGERYDVPELLQNADMLVLCSDDEGFPNVLLEAMAAYLPIISTPAGEAKFVVEDGVTGFLVPFDDIEEMAGRMVRLARSPSLRRQFGEAARQRVEQRYSSATLADAILSIYYDVAREQNNRNLLDVLNSHTRS